MSCLGIDQSMRSTGVCVVSESGDMLDYRIIDIDEKKNEQHSWIETEFQEHQNDTFKKVDLCHCVSEELYLYIENLYYEGIDISQINIEGLAFGIGGNVTRDLGALQFMIINKLRDSFTFHSYHNFDDGIIISAPTSVKKFATGSGSSKKNILFDALPEDVKEKFMKFPKTKGRFDLTDAYWLARYGLTNYGG